MQPGLYRIRGPAGTIGWHGCQGEENSRGGGRGWGLEPGEAVDKKGEGKGIEMEYT